MTKTLNQGQQAAADGFFEFLMRDNEKEMILSGPGGVGKTFLMGYLIDTIMPQYETACKAVGMKQKYQDVIMTATTNKAAEVLSLATGRPASTVHSHFSLKIKEDFRNGKTTLVKNRDWKVHQYEIIFIDECSMIDSPLRREILEGTNQCKIVYVGDHCQLAPVMETLSPIYRDGLRMYELTEPMRTGDKYLQALNQQMRDQVETGLFLPIHTMPGVIDWLTQDEMIQEVHQHFINKANNDRMLAYTNDQVRDLNKYVRDLRGLPKELTVGERLVNNQMVELGNNRNIRVEEEVEIVALSDDIESRWPHPEAEIQVRLGDLRMAGGDVIADVPIPVDRAHAQAVQKWLASTKKWPEYFLMKKQYPDLRERDAQTTHKAQGSSYDTVYIDAGDISTCKNADQTARLLYVGTSRARHRVVFYGELAQKFGGLVR